MVNIKVSIPAFIGLVLMALTGSAKIGAPFNVSDQTVTIKQGQSITLHAASINGLTFQWIKDGSNIVGATQNSYVVTLAGVYQVISTNSASCSSELSDQVTVIVEGTTAMADMQIGIASVLTSANKDDPFKYTILLKNNGPATAKAVKMQDHLPEEVQFQQLSPPATGTAGYSTFNKDVNWQIEQMLTGQTAELNFTVKALKTGIVKNTATVTAETPDPDLSNNSATDIRTLTGLIIPNVFTPNGDGLNETFEIPGLETSIANELTVMNRWGATVYQKKGYKNEWNGQGLNEGTYFYLLRVQFIAGKWDVYKGYITLLRAKVN
jgi:gliding motility-associated-like protein/uncharacterized repeat protein (TIGR01451 family)